MDNMSNIDLGLVKCQDHNLNLTNICTHSNCQNRLICPKCISKHDQFHIQHVEYLEEFIEKCYYVNDSINKIKEELSNRENSSSSLIDKDNQKVVHIFDQISSKFNEYISNKQNEIIVKFRDQSKSKYSFIQMQENIQKVQSYIEKIN